MTPTFYLYKLFKTFEITHDIFTLKDISYFLSGSKEFVASLDIDDLATDSTKFPAFLLSSSHFN